MMRVLKTHKRWLALAAGLMLAACQTTQDAAESAVAATLKSPLQTIGPTLDQLAAERRAQMAPQLVQKPKINDDPTQVVGLQPRELQSLLGPPEFVRRDLRPSLAISPHRVRLDLFLYSDAGAGHKVVSHPVPWTQVCLMRRA